MSFRFTACFLVLVAADLVEKALHCYLMLWVCHCETVTICTFLNSGFFVLAEFTLLSLVIQSNYYHWTSGQKPPELVEAGAKQLCIDPDVLIDTL